MRYFPWVFAVLLACPGFGQNAPSGVLVPAPPKAFHLAVGEWIKGGLKVPKAATAVPLVVTLVTKPCAIRLTEVPLKEGIDNGIFAKDRGLPASPSMIVEPPAPACPKGNGK